MVDHTYGDLDLFIGKTTTLLGPPYDRAQSHDLGHTVLEAGNLSIHNQADTMIETSSAGNLITMDELLLQLSGRTLSKRNAMSDCNSSAKEDTYHNTRRPSGSFSVAM